MPFPKLKSYLKRIDICMTNDPRLNELHHWLQHDQGWKNYQLEIASADASFRRYFRLVQEGKSVIVMDAPPDKEDVRPFIDVTERLRNAQVQAPAILGQSTTRGFLILDDLGSTPYLDQLNPKNADHLYGDAIHALIRLQQADTQNLAEYDQCLLKQEMQLMPDWFLKKHLKLTLSDPQQALIEQTLQAISDAIEEQPKRFVHRDYHSRNLMITNDHNPGIIDYQDAVVGAITYDLVSLLRDCYIAWPQTQVEKWALNYRDQAVKAGLFPAVDDATFLRWFDLMGLQRHLKVLGIFARLYHRDGKSGYLNDLPLTLDYTLKIGKKHPETQALIQLFEELKIPEQIGLQ